MNTTKNIKTEFSSKNIALKHEYVPPAQRERETKTGTETYGIWRNRIETTLNWLTSRYWNGHNEWKKAYQIFKGDHWWDKDDIDQASDNVSDRITVNIAGSIVQNLVPFILSRNPEFRTKPRKPESNVSAMLQQEIVNYEFQQQEMIVDVERCIEDFIICGNAIMRTGFELEVDVPKNKEAGEINYNDHVKSERPWIRRVSPFHFLFDPAAPDRTLKTARWCAEIFFNTKQDVLDNPRYNKKLISEIKAGIQTLVCRPSLSYVQGGGVKGLSLMETTEKPNNSSDIVTLYEVWDKKFKKYYIFAENIEEPLLEKPWPYDYLNGFPYVMEKYINIPNEPYGVGVCYAVKDQQFELNRVRTSMFNHRRRFNRKYEVVANAANDEGELNKLADGEDGAIILVKQANAIRPIPDAEQSDDTFKNEQIIKQDLQELTGSDALLRGGNLPSRTTAGEVSTRANIFRMKLETKVGAADRFILNIGKQILAHCKANYVTDRVTKIVGNEGEYWVRYSSQDIQDEVDVSMETVSAPKIDPQIERQQRLQVFQMATQLLPLIQAGAVQMNLNELIKWVLESFGQKDMGRFFPAALVPNAPLVQQPTPVSQGNSNGLNQQQPTPPDQPMSVQDLQKTFSGGAITNASGLQL